MTTKVHNFSAGPCLLPQSVYQKSAQAILDYNHTGVSILSMSHRSKEFIAILEEAQSLALSLLGLSDKKYSVLFLQGGASMEFLRVPYNFLKTKVCYLDTGVWANKAMQQAKLFGQVDIGLDGKQSQYTSIPSEVYVDQQVDYLHWTSNNTIYGTQFKAPPIIKGDIPSICDMSSDIYSREFPYQEIDLIYAGAQKNIGPAGVSVVIISKDLMQRAKSDIPAMLDYAAHIEHRSLYHTANVFGIYTCLLNLQWLQSQNGVKQMHKRNLLKSDLLYNTIDELDFLQGIAQKDSRSMMNVTWKFDNAKQEELFDQLAKENSIVNIKGHRTLGGYRASLYNALDIESVEVLTQVLHHMKTLV
ncbi:3-phosphoserine/phosphohydroxythreonine transaminase [Myroides sp. LJL115]